MWEYTDKVQQHFLNPQNVGEVENASGAGEVGSLACGDALKLSFKADTNDIIIEAKFKTFGCASAIASSSVLTEIMIGKSVDEASKITNEDIADALGGDGPRREITPGGVIRRSSGVPRLGRTDSSRPWSG